MKQVRFDPSGSTVALHGRWWKFADFWLFPRSGTMSVTDMLHKPPPELPLDHLRITAKIDYVTVAGRSGVQENDGLEGVGIWAAPNKQQRFQRWLTVHDATREQIMILIEKLHDPIVMALEIAVDFMPLNVGTHEVQRQLLDTTFQAVAARFRPEDSAIWAYGMRGAVSGRGMPVEPLERKRARTEQEVIYGHRSEFMQAKLYLKTMDQHVPLPVQEHVVRMEVSLRRGACIDDQFGIDRISSLLGFNYRAVLTKHFRLIQEPRVRLTRGLKAAERMRREKAMHRAWCLAGVAKFAIPLKLPADTLLTSIKQIKKRRRAQLPHDHYKLMRDQRANAKIGVALTNLQRRMRTMP